MDITATKICSACQRVLPRSMFSKHAQRRDGLSSQCKECKSQAAKAYWQAKTSGTFVSQRERRLAACPDGKYCPGCNTAKPLDAFHVHQTRPDGRQAYCKACQTVQHREWVETHPDYFAAFVETAQHAAAADLPKHCAGCDRVLPRSAFSVHVWHRDGLSTRCKECSKTPADEAHAYYLDNRKRILAPKPVEHLDPETTLKTCTRCGVEQPLREFHKKRTSVDGRSPHCKICAHMMNISPEHREYANEYNRLRYAAQREKLRAYARAWSKAHPEANRLKEARRRARKVGLPDTLTDRDVEFLYQYWQFSCAVCGREEGLFGFFLCLDHWVPLAASDCPGTTALNTILLCHGEGGCNNSKGDVAPLDWLTRRYGPRKARQIIRKVEAYFAVVRERGQQEAASA